MSDVTAMNLDFDIHLYDSRPKRWWRRQPSVSTIRGSLIVAAQDDKIGAANGMASSDAPHTGVLFEFVDRSKERKQAEQVAERVFGGE